MPTVLRRSSALLVSVAALALPAAAAAAPARCADSTQPPPTYHVDVAFDTPTADTISGDALVQATVSIDTTDGSRPSALPTALYFCLDGDYLLAAFQTVGPPATTATTWAASYRFRLRTASYPDGEHTLRASPQIGTGGITLVGSGSIAPSFQNSSQTPTVPAFATQRGRPPAAGQPLVVAAAGDGAGGQTTTKGVVDLIKSWRPNLFLYLGDVYEKGSPTEFFNWYDGFDPTSGQLGSGYGDLRSVTAPVVGNHEYNASLGSTTAPGFDGYWGNVPRPYSFDLGGWHFLGIDSTTSSGDTTGPSSPQYRAVRSALDAWGDGACTIPFYHHPRFSAGLQGDNLQMAALWSLFVSHHVPLALSGHDHSYQRWQPVGASGTSDPAGVTELIAGTGGHAIQAFGPNADLSRVAALDDHDPGAIRLELTADTAAIEFWTSRTSPPTLIDSATVRCASEGPPVDTSPPTIAGIAAAGETLACDPGTWSNTTSLAYSWRRGGALVATGPTYLVGRPDGGATLVCRVTATNAAGTGHADSAAVVVRPTAKAPPTISGRVAAASTLTCTSGGFVGADSTAYAWRRNGVSLPGATRPQYLLVAADIGEAVDCQVTATNAGGSTTTTSALAALPAVPRATVPPAIAGTVRLGATLTCSPGSWVGGPMLTLVWTRRGAPIAGATPGSYTLVGADADADLGCRVTATNASGTASADAVPVHLPAPPILLVAPRIEGVIALGSTVTCSTGSWAGAPSLAVGWRRNESAIVGATGPGYALVATDIAAAVSCEVAATNAGGTTVADSGPVSLPLPPRALGRPTVVGNATAGSRVTCSARGFAGATSIAVSWALDGHTIRKATTRTFLELPSQAGHRLACRETATNAGGQAGAASPARRVAPLPLAVIDRSLQVQRRGLLRLGGHIVFAGARRDRAQAVRLAGVRGTVLVQERRGRRWRTLISARAVGGGAYRVGLAVRGRGRHRLRILFAPTARGYRVTAALVVVRVT